MTTEVWTAHEADPAGGRRTNRELATAITRCPVCSPRRDMRATRHALYDALEQRLALLDLRDAVDAQEDAQWRASRLHKFPTLEDAGRIAAGAWRV